jgi:outer membrane protein OmpA-like peptidoglycan-associated protein
MSHTRRGMATLVVVVLLSSMQVFTQNKPAEPSFSALYWVNYWSHLPVSLFGPEEEAFNKSMEVILFPWNDHDDPSNPNALDSNAQWLKDHPNVRFYLDGYASSRGGLIYNLALAQRRADWVKQALIMRGVAENRIKNAVGWGELYPVCPESNDECWSKNRLVRPIYTPN